MFTFKWYCMYLISCTVDRLERALVTWSPCWPCFYHMFSPVFLHDGPYDHMFLSAQQLRGPGGAKSIHLYEFITTFLTTEGGTMWEPGKANRQLATPKVVWNPSHQCHNIVTALNSDESCWDGFPLQNWGYGEFPPTFPPGEAAGSDCLQIATGSQWQRSPWGLVAEVRWKVRWS